MITQIVQWEIFISKWIFWMKKYATGFHMIVISIYSYSQGAQERIKEKQVTK